ncbi:MAG: beta-ketoacyl synthase N-terminal-like domain-containing protein, partial [Planctomycetota bacterium]
MAFSAGSILLRLPYESGSVRASAPVRLPVVPLSHVDPHADAARSDQLPSAVDLSAAERQKEERAATRTAPRTKRAPKYFTGSTRTQRLTGVQVVGTGAYVPTRTVTNDELEIEHGFEPGWIERRTGILERRHAARDQATSDLCVPAARDAMHAAGLKAADVDLLVVGTFTPDQACPSTANLVQHKLGMDAPAFDVQAACSGFMYALVTAAQYVATGNAKHALVIGADLNSRIVD